MRKLTRIMAALAAMTMVFGTVNIMAYADETSSKTLIEGNSEHSDTDHAEYQAGALMESTGYVEVNAGSIFDETVSAFNWHDTEGYRVFVPDKGKPRGRFLLLTPWHGMAFELADNIDSEKAEKTLRPILDKYEYPFDFKMSWDSLYTCEIYYNALRDGDIDLDKVKEQSDLLMNELKETGIVQRFYPYGSMYHQHTITGDASDFWLKDKEKLTEYVKNNLSGFSVAESKDKLTLIADSSETTLQDEFDALSKIYEDTGITGIFAEGLQETLLIGYGVELTGNVENKTTSTLKGDADLSGSVDLADLTTVAKYNLSNEAYPLANDTAYANADMNGDGKVDGLDISALIEAQLGKEYVEPVQSDKAVELTANLKPYSIEASKPSTKFENSQIDFAISLLKNSLEEKDNTLVSGYSAAQALAMTANGADGNTLDEMMKVIGGGMNTYDLNTGMAAFKNSQPNNEYCKLLTANSIWYTNDTSRFIADKNFLLKNKSYYDAEIYAAPMDDNTVSDLNNWVSEHTDKMIPEIIKEFVPDTVMALVNAVTFDAKWISPYTDVRNKTGYFTSADGKKQDAEVLCEKDGMRYLEDKEATGFVKFYGGGDYAFAAILPNEGISADDYVKGLTTKKFVDLMNSHEAHPSAEVETQMPKFSVDYGKSLIDVLKAMGIKDAFDGNTADFSKMGKSQNGLCIGEVIQKTHIEVDDEGTKAAAATIVEMLECCAPMYKEEKKVILNRPFVYAIVDTETNIPVFMGTLNTLE